MAPNETSTDASQFVGILRQWAMHGNFPFDIVTIRPGDDEPCVIYQIADDTDVAAAAQERRFILGACTSAFKKTEYAVDSVRIIGLLQDQDNHVDAVQWRLQGDWIRAYDRDDLSFDDLADHVNATVELIENFD